MEKCPKCNASIYIEYIAGFIFHKCSLRCGYAEPHFISDAEKAEYEKLKEAMSPGE